DTKIYYNFNKLANKSTAVEFAAGTTVDCGGVPCDNALYDYRKNKFGIEGIYRIDRGNRLQGGYDYLDVDQNRFDYNNVRDNKLWVEWKNTSVENLTFRVKYWYLQRRSDFLLSNVGVD